MVKYDLRTREGLRAACRQAEIRFDDVDDMAKNEGFLQAVDRTSDTERNSGEFLRLIWDDNPLAGLGAGDFNVKDALADPDFRRRFLELTTAPLPEDSARRANQLDAAFNETLDNILPYMRPAGKTRKRARPRIKTARAFAALFPNDFTALINRKHRNEILKSMGEKTWSNKYPAQANRRIIERLNDALGPVDLSDLASVARRMKLPWKLFELLHDADKDPPIADQELSLIKEHFESAREEDGLVFDDDIVEVLHLGLWAHERRHFAVLTGLSGTGKTQLALQYAAALNERNGTVNEQVCTVPVQPGWYDPTPLLGYVNPLGESRYIQTEFLRFLIRASKNPTEPYVCVLDEMNLSHPEQYLAPILSAMEREDGDIPLHGGDGDEYGVSPSIRYPRNLVLIGTVNMDETTMGISDKVLDRAFTLEFWDIDVDRWPGWDEARLEVPDKASVKEILKLLMATLSPARLHFGWRVIADVVQFMELRQAQSAELSADDALDRVIYAKVLPKLRGDDSPRVRGALKRCQTVLKERNLTRCADKVDDLIQDLNETGSFRFWR